MTLQVETLVSAETAVNLTGMSIRHSRREFAQRGAGLEVFCAFHPSVNPIITDRRTREMQPYPAAAPFAAQRTTAEVSAVSLNRVRVSCFPMLRLD